MASFGKSHPPQEGSPPHTWVADEVPGEEKQKSAPVTDGRCLPHAPPSARSSLPPLLLFTPTKPRGRWHREDSLNKAPGPAARLPLPPRPG